MVQSGFRQNGVGGVGVKLTFSVFNKITFLVSFVFVGWLMNPSKSDFGAPKRGPLDSPNGLQKLAGENKNMGNAEKNGSIPELTTRQHKESNSHPHCKAVGSSSDTTQHAYPYNACTSDVDGIVEHMEITYLSHAISSSQLEGSNSDPSRGRRANPL